MPRISIITRSDGKEFLLELGKSEFEKLFPEKLQPDPHIEYAGSGLDGIVIKPATVPRRGTTRQVEICQNIRRSKGMLVFARTYLPLERMGLVVDRREPVAVEPRALRRGTLELQPLPEHWHGPNVAEVSAAFNARTLLLDLPEAAAPTAPDVVAPDEAVAAPPPGEVAEQPAPEPPTAEEVAAEEEVERKRQAPPKDIRALERAAKTQGWTIALTRGGHVKWSPPDKAKNGFVISASTPSDHRALMNHLARIRRAGFTWPPPETPKPERTSVVIDATMPRAPLPKPPAPSRPNMLAETLSEIADVEENMMGLPGREMAQRALKRENLRKLCGLLEEVNQIVQGGKCGDVRLVIEGNEVAFAKMFRPGRNMEHHAVAAE